MSAISAPWYAQQFFGLDGKPLSGGKLYFFVAGTNVPKTIYADPDYQTPLPNPLTLDASGYPPHYLLGAGFYKIEVRDRFGVQVGQPYDNVSGASSSGGEGGAVDSVFGRTGNVEAQSGDYTAAMVGAEAALGAPSANGQVLSSTTGSVRSWIDLPTSLPPSGPASGDLGGSYPSPTVVGLRGAGLPALGTGNLRYESGAFVFDSTAYQPYDSDLVAIAGLAGTRGLLRKMGANAWSLDTASYLTANQSITLSGDVAGTGNTAIATTVTGLRGSSVPTLSAGRLRWNGAGLEWQAAQPISSGVVGTMPTLTRSTDQVVVGSFACQLWPNATFAGDPVLYSISGVTLSAIPRDGNTRFIAVRYNGGTPICYLETDKSVFIRSDYAGVAAIWNTDGSIHLTDFGSSGDGMATKLQRQSLSTVLYQRSLDGGLALYEDGARHVGVTSALVYHGGEATLVPGYGSANTNHKLTLVYHLSSVWTYQTTTTGGVYNNTQYDNGTNLVAMGTGKYAVRWMYRSIGDDTQVFYVLGTSEYNSVAQAQAEGVRVVPEILRDHCMLVGRIVVQNGASSGIVSSAFSNQFSITPVSDHNQLISLQGGTAGQYYHLTSAQSTGLTGGSTTTLHNHDIDGGNW